MDLLAEAMRAWAVQPWRWGYSDCSASVLHLARLIRGRHDEPWPLRHRSARGAALAIARAGGLDVLAGRYLEPLGFVRVGDDAPPCRWDMAVIDQGDGVHRMAICLGRRWAARGERGAHVFTPRAILARWRAG